MKFRNSFLARHSWRNNLRHSSSTEDACSRRTRILQFFAIKNVYLQTSNLYSVQVLKPNYKMMIHSQMIEIAERVRCEKLHYSSFRILRAHSHFSCMLSTLFRCNHFSFLFKIKKRREKCIFLCKQWKVGNHSKYPLHRVEHKINPLTNVCLLKTKMKLLIS